MGIKQMVNTATHLANNIVLGFKFSNAGIKSLKLLHMKQVTAGGMALTNDLTCSTLSTITPHNLAFISADANNAIWSNYW